MFTGIVVAQGTVEEVSTGKTGSTLRIRCPGVAGQLTIGDSVSVDGVCLTVVSGSDTEFSLEATPETLRLTTLGERRTGDLVNLEPAARMHDFVGGHLVQGHVDETGRIAHRRVEGNSLVFRIEAPSRVLRYCAHKGSVTVNGVSLTISDLDSEGFEVTIIPHTSEVTNFRDLDTGDRVNLEADVVSKYVEAHVKRILGTVSLVVFSMGAWLSGAGMEVPEIQVPPKTVLIYKHTTKLGSKQFVIRVARYQPDIVLEWESHTDQGTVQIYGEAVESARGFTLSSLFQVGMHNDATRRTTLWLSRAMFDRVRAGKSVKMDYNQAPLKLKVRERGRQTIAVNGVEQEVDAIHMDDNRRGSWVLLDDRDNPLILQYTSPYFESRLTKILNTGTEKLRWIKTLPPVK